MRHIACSKMEFVHKVTHFGHYALHIGYLTMVYLQSHATYGLVAGALGVATLGVSIIDWKAKKRHLMLMKHHKD